MPQRIFQVQAPVLSDEMSSASSTVVASPPFTKARDFHPTSLQLVRGRGIMSQPRPTAFSIDHPFALCWRQKATDAHHGAELWRTDGTGAGTVLVKDLYPGEKSGAPTSFTPYGDYLYFQVR